MGRPQTEGVSENLYGGLHLNCHSVQPKRNLLEENFPKGEANNNEVAMGQTNGGSDLGKSRYDPTPAKVCGCPERRETPEPPAMEGLNVTMTEVNREKLENLTKEHYKRSALNVCPHHELPVMTGDLLRIVVDPRVKPSGVHKPVLGPLHWRDTVWEPLANDCKMGVI